MLPRTNYAVASHDSSADRLWFTTIIYFFQSPEEVIDDREDKIAQITIF